MNWTLELRVIYGIALITISFSPPSLFLAVTASVHRRSLLVSHALCPGQICLVRPWVA